MPQQPPSRDPPCTASGIAMSIQRPKQNRSQSSVSYHQKHTVQVQQQLRIYCFNNFYYSNKNLLILHVIPKLFINDLVLRYQ